MGQCKRRGRPSLLYSWKLNWFGKHSWRQTKPSVWCTLFRNYLHLLTQFALRFIFSFIPWKVKQKFTLWNGNIIPGRNSVKMFNVEINWERSWPQEQMSRCVSKCTEKVKIEIPEFMMSISKLGADLFIKEIYGICYKWD